MGRGWRPCTDVIRWMVEREQAKSDDAVLMTSGCTVRALGQALTGVEERDRDDE